MRWGMSDRPRAFCEFPAGLAAVSLRLHGGPNCKPPISRMGNKAGFANGGRVKAYPDMEAGAASGPGRLEKVKEYGDRAGKKTDR